MSKTSPDFKGIKTQIPAVVQNLALSKTSPDFKGIKTRKVCDSLVLSRSKTSPDFKGIKTVFKENQQGPLSPRPALISKGLRRD